MVDHIRGHNAPRQTASKKQHDMATKTYRYATDSDSGTITAASLDAAYDTLRAKITDATIADGATLWVEDVATGDRRTLRS